MPGPADSPAVLIGLLQRVAHLADDPGQFPAREGHSDDIAEELADRGEGGVTGPLEVGDQGRQMGPGQAAAFDPHRERGLVELPAMRAPPRMTAMLLNHQRHFLDVDLLDHPGRDRAEGLQILSAPGAEVDVMIEGPSVERFGREGDPFMLGMSGLSADPPLVLALRGRRLGRLDDVRGGGLGGR
jgi:hypothetical protein